MATDNKTITTAGDEKHFEYIRRFNILKERIEALKKAQAGFQAQLDVKEQQFLELKETAKNLGITDLNTISANLVETEGQIAQTLAELTILVQNIETELNG